MVLLAASAWQCLSSGNAAPSAQQPQSRAELTRLWRYFSWKGESNSVSHLFPVLLGLADLWFSPSSCLVPSFLLGHKDSFFHDPGWAPGARLHTHLQRCKPSVFPPKHHQNRSTFSPTRTWVTSLHWYQH